MITIRAGRVLLSVCLLVFVAACSREQQDWRSAEAADTVEAYDQFVERHPQSELAAQARLRAAQLAEDKDWQAAGSADTPDAYRQFITQHPNGKWAQEARIRLENFSLGAQPGSTGSGGASASAAAPVAMRSSATTAAQALAGEPATPAVPVAAKPAVAPTHTTPATAQLQTPAAVQQHADGGAAGFGIQLGAFGSESAANTQWQSLTGRFGPDLQGLTPAVVPANTSSGRLYRLQAAVGDESRARALCDTLRKRGQACVLVLPH